MVRMRKTVKRIFCVIAWAVLLSGLLSCVAQAAAPKVLTVAYIDYNNFLEKSADGTYTGYGADYLNAIAEYTGWEYEFVDMDWPTAYEAVKAGTVDFYCVARQTVERQAEFDFSLFPLCNEELNIYTLPESEIYYEDYTAFDGLKVGVLEASVDTGYFQQYAAAHDFSCDLREYPTNSKVVAALEAGEVDLIAIVSYAVEGDFKLVGSFGASPAYLMSAKDSPYMQTFSEAQEKLYIDVPSYSQMLERTHYGKEQQISGLMLTRDEADFIKNTAPLTVAISVDMAPIEYYDEKNKVFKGVSIELFDRISEMTGLEFRFVPRHDAPTLIAEMNRGDVQLVGALAQSDAVASALHLTQTQPFSDNSLTLVTKDMDAITAKSVVAVPAGYPMFSNTAKEDGYSVLEEYASFEECVDAVYAGKADLTYVITMCEGYLLDHARYSELRAYPCADVGYGMCFGVYNEYDPQLISIIDKCIAAIPEKDVNEVIVANTAHAEPTASVKDLFVRNGSLISIVGVLFIALIAFVIIRSQKAKQQTVLTKRLQQHHDFLQHLYDTLPCGVFRYSYEAPHRILYYNSVSARIYGYEDGNFPIVGENPAAVVEKGTEEAFQEKFSLCEATGPVMYGLLRKRTVPAYIRSPLWI